VTIPHRTYDPDRFSKPARRADYSPLFLSRPVNGRRGIRTLKPFQAPRLQRGGLTNAQVFQVLKVLPVSSGLGRRCVYGCRRVPNILAEEHGIEPSGFSPAWCSGPIGDLPRIPPEEGNGVGPSGLTPRLGFRGRLGTTPATLLVPAVGSAPTFRAYETRVLLIGRGWR